MKIVGILKVFEIDLEYVDVLGEVKSKVGGIFLLSILLEWREIFLDY